MNIACDQLAWEVTAAALANPDELPPPEEILHMPYKGSKAVLRIGKEWVTAKEKRHLYNAKRGPNIWTYIKRRHKWSDEQYDSVNWDTIGKVRRRVNISEQRFHVQTNDGVLMLVGEEEKLPAELFFSVGWEAGRQK
eukprot:scaffold33422_cov67-Skeletonema_dohrnii-CCMP3373.AAC.2